MPQDPAYDLFVSYADVDRAWVEGYLLDALTQAGVRVYSEAAFALGVPRLLEFERAGAPDPPPACRPAGRPASVGLPNRVARVPAGEDGGCLGKPARCRDNALRGPAGRGRPLGGAPSGVAARSKSHRPCCT